MVGIGPGPADHDGGTAYLLSCRLGFGMGQALDQVSGRLIRTAGLVNVGR